MLTEFICVEVAKTEDVAFHLPSSTWPLVSPELGIKFGIANQVVARRGDYLFICSL